MNLNNNHLYGADPLLNVRVVAEMLDVSVPTVWRMSSNGTIPRPIKLGGSSRWPQSEIQRVIEAAKADRSEEVEP